MNEQEKKDAEATKDAVPVVRFSISAVGVVAHTPEKKEPDEVDECRS